MTLQRQTALLLFPPLKKGIKGDLLWLWIPPAKKANPPNPLFQRGKKAFHLFLRGNPA